MTSQLTITVPTKVLQEIHDLCDASLTIRAIKLARSEGRVMGRGDKPGLKEAKHAIDHLRGSISADVACAILVPAWRVHTLTVSGPAGERMELDIDQLQMRFLSSLHVVGLEEVGRLIQLVDFIKDWQMDPVKQPEVETERSDT